jgi:predicted alpha/beta-hydrolase family hydrolase
MLRGGKALSEAPELYFNGPPAAPVTLALAHGAGAPMDTPFMNFFAEALAESGLRMARFEFAYMAARRQDGRRRPPDREARLLEVWRAVEACLAGEGPLVIGGKSMGGRMASLVADELGVAGLVCLGYPFHPPGRPERLRTAHLASLKVPTLICQGTRDPFGTQVEVEGYTLSPSITLRWAEDGNHDLVPRKSSGGSAERNWADAAAAITAFALGLAV